MNPVSATELGQGPGTLQIAILYKRFMPLDEQVTRMLEGRLAAHGFRVFTDRHLTVGLEWAREIEARIRQADAVIPILSAGAAQSEMISYEVELAHEAAERNNGRPWILPVRVAFESELPESLARILDPIQYSLWRNAQDDQQLLTELVDALRRLQKSPELGQVGEASVRLRSRLPSRPVSPASVEGVSRAPIPDVLEPVGGAVPLGSPFYVVRPQDAEFKNALSRYDSIVLIKGARQMGKTSLLARGLQQARERGAKVVLSDFQKLNVSDLESANRLYLSLALSIQEQLDLPVAAEDVWDERRGPNVNFERYLRREVLAKLNAPLVWGLDEVDRLFTCSFGSEVFGLFRSWHNERALDPSGPWAGLTLAIAYATEAHLFITDMNQSPFNVGTRLGLEDFTGEQVAELNRRYRSVLKSEAEQNRLIQLVGGQPFLVRRALHEMVSQSLSLTDLEFGADRDEGIFGDHLRRILVLLAKDFVLTEIVRGVLCGQPCPNQESFYRLRSAGLVSGTSPADAHLRCALYASYLKRHLLD